MRESAHSADDPDLLISSLRTEPDNHLVVAFHWSAPSRPTIKQNGRHAQSNSHNEKMKLTLWHQRSTAVGRMRRVRTDLQRGDSRIQTRLRRLTAGN